MVQIEDLLDEGNFLRTLNPLPASSKHLLEEIFPTSLPSTSTIADSPKFDGNNVTGCNEGKEAHVGVSTLRSLFSRWKNLLAGEESSRVSEELSALSNLHEGNSFVKFLQNASLPNSQSELPPIGLQPSCCIQVDESRVSSVSSQSPMEIDNILDHDPPSSRLTCGDLCSSGVPSQCTASSLVNGQINGIIPNPEVCVPNVPGRPAISGNAAASRTLDPVTGISDFDIMDQPTKPASAATSRSRKRHREEIDYTEKEWDDTESESQERNTTRKVTRRRKKAAKKRNGDDNSNEGIVPTAESATKGGNGNSDKRGAIKGKLTYVKKYKKYKKKGGFTMIEPTHVIRDVILSLGRISTAEGLASVKAVLESCVLEARTMTLVDQEQEPLDIAFRRVRNADLDVAKAEISYLIACVHFAAALCRDHRNLPEKIKDLKNRLNLDIPDQTLKDYYFTGIKYGLLMQGGTIHILVMIVALKMRQKIEQLFIGDLATLAEYLRAGDCGDDKTCSDLIVETIVPFIIELKRICLIHVAGATGEDIDLDDQILNTKINETNTFSLRLSERHSAWKEPATLTAGAIYVKEFFDSLQVSQQPMLVSSTDWLKTKGLKPLAAEENIIIDMGMNLSKDLYGKMPKELIPDKSAMNPDAAAEAWTKLEVEKILHGNTTHINSVGEMKQILRDVGVTCNGNRRGGYLYIPSNINNGADLVIRTKWEGGGSHVAAVLLSSDSIASDLKKRLWNTIVERTKVYDDYITAAEEAVESAMQNFTVFHLNFWSRYSEKAKKGQPKIHPGKIPGNKTQRIPRPSEQLRENKDGADDLVKDLADIYEVIERKILSYFPDSKFDLETAVDALPGSESTGRAFLGLVVNLHARTCGHRDQCDLHFCVVIPFGDFKGGELVLYELGLIFELKGGDILIFESANLTHFNMPITEGHRGSLVLHTDNSIQSYIKDRNGWDSYLN